MVQKCGNGCDPGNGIDAVIAILNIDKKRANFNEIDQNAIFLHLYKLKRKKCQFASLKTFKTGKMRGGAALVG